MLITEINNYLGTTFQRKLVVWLKYLTSFLSSSHRWIYLKNMFNNNNKMKKWFKKFHQILRDGQKICIYIYKTAFLKTIYRLTIFIFIYKGTILSYKDLQRGCQVSWGKRVAGQCFAVIVYFCCFISWVLLFLSVILFFEFM